MIWQQGLCNCVSELHAFILPFRIEFGGPTRFCAKLDIYQGFKPSTVAFHKGTKPARVNNNPRLHGIPFPPRTDIIKKKKLAELSAHINWSKGKITTG
jgi:hypothetical protein